MQRPRRRAYSDPVKPPVLLPALLLTLPLSSLPLSAPPLLASDKPPSGQTATLIREAPIYISANAETQRLDRISPGRELMIAERSGKWLRVFANTDVEQNRASDAPVFDTESSTPPISGWIEDAGVISAATPNGDAILFGAAASAELAASEPHAPRGSAQAARLLYTRTAQIFPQSAHAPEAAWRAADIRWQLEKADVFSRPSAQEKESYLRQQIADDEMRKIEKKYPHTKWSDLAAWDMLDNKICGDWQGSTKCPEKESEMFEKYADEHPDSPKAAEALFDAAYRQGAAGDIYAGSGDDKKASAAHEHAGAIAGKLQSRYSASDYAARAATLIYKLQQSIPIYGVDRE
jgi:hypothetical protein